MGVVIPPGVAQSTFLFTNLANSKQYCLTLGVDLGGDIADQEIASAMRTWWGGTAGRPFSAGNLVAGYRFDGVRVQLGMSQADTTAGVEPTINADLTAIAGTASNPGMMPPNCAYLVKKTTNRGGRRQRGRWYVPPFWIGEAQVNDAGFLTPSSVAAMQATIDAALNVMVTQGHHPMLLHSRWDTPPTPITGFQMQTKIATQRRRL